jgi:hypothetical protein
MAGLKSLSKVYAAIAIFARRSLFLEGLMRLWLVSLGAVLAFGVSGVLVAEYAGSQFEYIARLLGATPSIEFVKSVVADLQSKNFAALEEKLDRSYVNEQSRSAFAEINRQLPSSPPKSIRLASLSWTLGPPRRTTLSLEYGIDDKWFLVNARVRTSEGEPPILEWFNLQPTPASLEDINRFSLQGRSGIHYFFLTFLIAIGTCSAAALIICVRHKMPLWRKIIWSIGILSGVGTCTLNWTSGSLHFQLLSIHIPAVGFLRASTIAPYSFWFSVPVFAIWFLFLQIEVDGDRTQGEHRSNVKPERIVDAVERRRQERENRNKTRE